jgi:hypothetical protein
MENMTEMEMTTTEFRADVVLAAIKNLPLSADDKNVVVSLLASNEAWMSEEDEGTFAQALAKKAYATVI